MDQRPASDPPPTQVTREIIQRMPRCTRPRRRGPCAEGIGRETSEPSGSRGLGIRPYCESNPLRLKMIRIFVLDDVGRRADAVTGKKQRVEFAGGEPVTQQHTLGARRRRPVGEEADAGELV